MKYFLEGCKQTIITLIIVSALVMGCDTVRKNIDPQELIEKVEKEAKELLDKEVAEYTAKAKELVGLSDEEKEDKENEEAGHPFKLSQLKDCSRAFSARNPQNFPITQKLNGASISGGVLNYDCTGVNVWPGKENHELVIVVKIDGEWLLATTEHGFKGKGYNRFAECFKPTRGNGKRMFNSPMDKFDPEQAQEIGFFVIAKNVNERSNIIMLPLP